MNCKEFRKCIDTYLDNEQDEKEPVAFVQQLKSCSDCRLQLISFDKCIKLLSRVKKDVNPPDKIRKGVFMGLWSGC